jgi:hypothetical protein
MTVPVTLAACFKYILGSPFFRKKANGISVRLFYIVQVEPKARRRLTAIVLGFVGAFKWHAEVVGLFLRKLGELHADLFEVQTV